MDWDLLAVDSFGMTIHFYEWEREEAAIRL
jgi:hypothetical protein